MSAAKRAAEERDPAVASPAAAALPLRPRKSAARDERNRIFALALAGVAAGVFVVVIALAIALHSADLAHVFATD